MSGSFFLYSQFLCFLVSAIRWVTDGLIFEGLPSLRRKFPLFFRFVYFIVQLELHVRCCLAELAVVSKSSLCINHHTKGHQQCSGRAAKSRCTSLCYAYSQLIPFHALPMVWLPDSILQQCEKLAVLFSPEPSSPRMLVHTFTWPPRTQYTKASIDWFKRHSPAYVSPFALLHTNQLNCLSAPCLFLMNPRVFSLSFLPHSCLKTLIQRV